MPTTTTTTKKALTSSLLILGLASVLTGCSPQPTEPATAQGALPPSHTDYLNECSPQSQSEWMEQKHGVEPPADEVTYPAQGEYYFHDPEGTIGKLTLFTELPEDMAANQQTLIGDDPATYIRVDVDNRNGQAFSVNSLVAYDDAGSEYTFYELGNMMYEPLWDLFSETDYMDDAATEEYDQIDDYVSGLDSQVASGQVASVWLVHKGTDFPEEFTSIGLNGGEGYLGGLPLLPVEFAEINGVDLNFTVPEGQ